MKSKYGLLVSALPGCYSVACYSAHVLGLLDKKKAYVRKAFNYLDSDVSLFTKVYIKIFASQALLNEQEYQLIIPQLESGLLICENYRMNLLLPLAYGSLGYSYHLDGNTNEGIKMITKGLEICERANLNWCLLKLRLWLAEAYLAGGMIDSSMNGLTHSLEEPRIFYELYNQAKAHGLYAYASYLKEGIISSQASLSIDRASSICREQGYKALIRSISDIESAIKSGQPLSQKFSALESAIF